MKDNIILIIFVIILIIVIFLCCKNKKINNKLGVNKSDNNKLNNNKLSDNKLNNSIIYEEIIHGGVTNINFHSKITMKNVTIFNEHHKKVNKNIDKNYIDIVIYLSNIKQKDLLVIQSKEDHIGDYEILNHIIKINGFRIDYKKLGFFANCDEKFNKYKYAIDKIREYITSFSLKNGTP